MTKYTAKSGSFFPDPGADDSRREKMRKKPEEARAAKTEEADKGKEEVEDL